MSANKKALLIVVAIAAAFIGASPSPEDRIYTALSGLPPSTTDEPSERKLRLRTVATEIARVARNDHEAAALITLGWFESRFAAWVGNGCFDKPEGVKAHCDHGRARSYWQMWQRACPAGWAYPPGDASALREFAQCAVRHWRFAERTCASRPNHGRVAGAYAGFRTVSRCDWEPSRKRALMHARVLRRLR